jgi:hypothetical protein
MIYLFGKEKDVSIIYDGNALTDEEKKQAIIVKELPIENTPVGYWSMLCLDSANKPYWEYVKIETPIEE